MSSNKLLLQIAIDCYKVAFMAQEKLFPYTLRMLDENKGKHKEIAQRTGVKYTTLSKIAQRQTKNPGVLTVQAIADYFEAA